MSYIGNAPISAAFLTDTFSGTGSQTAYTMTVAPANTSSIIVAVTGVLQDPSTYSVSGTTLTFSAAPPSGTSNISVRYLGIPASGVTTTAYRTVTEFTATSGQTSFSVPSYTVGYIDVYRNGVMLGTADFTATTGTTVVLATGATTGDLIRTESFYVSSVLNAIANTAGSVSASNLAASGTGSSSNFLRGDMAWTSSTGTGSVVLATSPTITSPTMSGAVVSTMASSVITSGTVQNTTSGTSFTFSSIPSWVKRITVMLNGVSTSGSSPIRISFGTSGGLATSGYISYLAYSSNGASVSSNSATSGFNFTDWTSAANVFTCAIPFVYIGSNTWACTGANLLNETYPSYPIWLGGRVTLSGTLTQVALTTINGTDAFDAGSVNILYE